MMSYILSEQQKPIELYDSLVKYRRQGLSEVEEVTTSMKRKTTFTIIGSAVSGGSLLIGVILVAFYCRNKRKGES
jgi:ABC-type antimicrobial peptide transport system ATPase subunit